MAKVTYQINEKSRYHADLIRQLAEVGRKSMAENPADVVHEFLRTVCAITGAQTTSVYQHEDENCFERVYSYKKEGAVPVSERVILEKTKFPELIENFEQQDFVRIEKPEDWVSGERNAYEQICRCGIKSMIAFKLTFGGNLSGCMILENPDLEASGTFIELIPLIDVFLGNVRQNHNNEALWKCSQEKIGEGKIELERERQFLEVLCRDYTTVYHLDLIHDTLEALKMTKTANAASIQTIQMRKKINYTEHMRFYCNEYVASRNQKEVLRIMDRSNLLKELNRNCRFVYRYESKPNRAGQRYFEVAVIRINEAEFDGNVLMAFRQIDDILTQEQKNHQELEEALERERVSNEVLTALGRIYYSIFRINLDEDIYEEISSQEDLHRLTGKSGCASAELREICQTLVVTEYQERIWQFFDLSTLSERLKEEDTVAAEYLAKDGNWHTARFIVKRRNPDGRVTHVLYVTQLISDTKRREQNWIAIAENANRANEAKSEFVSQIAHDIRTPMNALFGFLELAEAHVTDPEKVKYCLRKIRVAGDFMKELVNDVLDISRMENGKVKIQPELVSLRELISEFPAAMQHAKMGKKLAFYSHFHDIPYDRVMLDPLRVKQIYSNILSNAVKYTPDGGSVTFEVYEDVIPDRRKVRITAVISDTGIGMSEEYMEKMYGKFSRETDTRINKVNGYGLGLSIVHQLVDLMGGTIDARSKVGEGTSFCVRMEVPYAEGQADTIRKEEPFYEDGACAGMHLLVAEDNDLNYEVITELLAMHGITCERAEDGIICIEKFERSEPGVYHAILMDMQMPNMNGVDAARNIRKLNRIDAATIPIIAMTANALREDVRKCMDAGMNEHMAKPVEIKRLLKLLYALCGENRPGKSS